MQAPNVYPFPQQPQPLSRFQYGPPQFVFDHSAPRVDPLQSNVTINPRLPVQHYNGHINPVSNNYAYYYHHLNNNNASPALHAANTQMPDNSLYRNIHQVPSAPQRLVSIIPDPHMPPNISHFQLNNIHPQMHVPVAHNTHFQQVPAYNHTNNSNNNSKYNSDSDKPVDSNDNGVLDNVDERYRRELNEVVPFFKNFENNALTSTPNNSDIQSTIDELAKLKSLSNSTHFKQSIATQNFYSLQNHITAIENRLTCLLNDRQQKERQERQQKQEMQQNSENENTSPPSNKIKLPSLQELTNSISTQHPPATYDNKRHSSDSEVKPSIAHDPLYHRHTFLPSSSSSSSSPTAGSVPLQKLQVPGQDQSGDAKKNVSTTSFNSITYLPSTILSPTVQTQLKSMATSSANSKKKNNRGRPRAIQRQPTLTTSSHFINNSNSSVATVSTSLPSASNREKDPDAKKIIEFCFHCGETETPEWRKGPYGTRTLCNACGLFYRKVTKKFGSKSSNLLLRYRRAVDLANDRRIPDFITIPNRFIHDMDNDQTLDSEYNTILQ